MSYKNELTKEVLLKRVFSDPKNYPYGFSRSGDFSISESKALVSEGALIAALVDGLIAPETQDDHDIVAVAHGSIEPKTTAHRAWLKYQKRINRPKTGSIYGTKKSTNNESSDDLVNDIDDDIDIGLDDD
ncbi:MAG: DUF413 domain-containing protein [Glaciecola sp.]